MGIRGICPIAPAVFDERGALDLEDYRRCCERMIEHGAEGLTLFGIAGEYYKLDAEEEEKLIGITVDVCRRGHVPSILSNTRHSTESALRRARRIEDAGADCMMVLPPFFLKPGGAALFDHLEAVCASVKIPVMLQYAPEQTGVGIAPEMLAKLARRHENLKYFKIECRPPGSYFSALKELLPEGREIFIGNAGFQMIEGFARGAAGVMPGPSMPDVYRAVWDALLAGNDAEARRIHGVLNAMLNHIRQNVEMIIFFEKRILKRRGFIRSDFCRTPAFRTDRIYDSIFDTLYEELRREFREAGNGKL